MTEDEKREFIEAIDEAINGAVCPHDSRFIPPYIFAAIKPIIERTLQRHTAEYASARDLRERERAKP
jgi:hypothetical protein